MRDDPSSDARRDDAIDQSYRAAAAATEDEPARLRRRAAVLGAVAAAGTSISPLARAIDSARADRPASDKRQPSRWFGTGAWSGAIAAYLLVTATALLVLQQREEPGAGGPALREETAARKNEKRPEVAVAARPAPAASAPADAAVSSARSPPSTPSAAAPALRARSAGSADNGPPAQATAEARAQAGAADSAPALALLAAVAARDVDAARRVLQTTRPDAATDGDGRTALALAVLNSDSRLVGLLIERGADRLARDRFGQAPLDYARQRADAAVLEALEEKR